MSCDLDTGLSGTQPVRKLIRYLLNRHFQFPFECAFPDDSLAPPGFSQPPGVGQVIAAVSPDFLPPEFLAALGPAEQVAFMAVPEAAMNKDHRMESWKYEIGPAGNTARMKPVAEAPRMKRAPDCQLGLCVPPSDSRHHPAADLAGDGISHAPAWVRDALLHQRQATLHPH